MTETMIEADDEFRGRGNAGPRDPDRRMRLLDRARPEIHHAELIMLAVPGKDFLRRPCLCDQRQRLAEALALLERNDGLGDRGGAPPSPGKSLDHPAAPD